MYAEKKKKKCWLYSLVGHLREMHGMWPVLFGSAYLPLQCPILGSVSSSVVLPGKNTAVLEHPCSSLLQLHVRV